MKTGVESITEERIRQVSKEGFLPEHDDEHDEGELALAAICYATPIPIFRLDKGANAYQFIDPWPWGESWDKRERYDNGNELQHPVNLARQDRVRNLVKAGALLAAEIDRINRINN